MTTLELFAGAVISALVTCVLFLFKQNNRLGERLDSMAQRLGIMQGFVTALKGCPVQGCHLKGLVPSDDDE